MEGPREEKLRRKTAASYLGRGEENPDPRRFSLLDPPVSKPLNADLFHDGLRLLGRNGFSCKQ